MGKIIVLFGHKDVIELVQKEGFYVINVLRPDIVEGTFLKSSKIADRTIIIKDLFELDNIIKVICENETIDHIVSFTDTCNGVQLAAKYSSSLLKENHFATEEAVKILKNKVLTRKHLERLNLNAVNYVVPKTINEVHDFISKHNKAIIKPVEGQASIDVTLLDKNTDLTNVHPDELKDGEFIVEEYIEGKEYSVESITYSGKTYIIGVTEKFKIGDNRFGFSPFVESGHTFPAVLGECVLNKI